MATLAAGVGTAKSLRESLGKLLRRKIRKVIVPGRGKRPARQRYFRACRRIDKLFGYALTDRPTRGRLGTVRSVQPRQHSVLGHSTLILEQMRRVARTVRKWLRREIAAGSRTVGDRPAAQRRSRQIAGTIRREDV